MSYFAQVPTIVNDQGIVVDVISADQAFIDSGAVGDPALWWQTSYNTHGGIHYGADGQPDGGVALRANYAGVGYTLNVSVITDGVVGVFYAPQPFPSWVISAPTWEWQAPVPYPSSGGPYVWDEATQSWVQVTQ
jgi:hypothetical protein